MPRGLSHQTMIFGETNDLHVSVEKRLPDDTTVAHYHIAIEERDGYLQLRVIRARNEVELHADLPGGTVLT